MDAHFEITFLRKRFRVFFVWPSKNYLKKITFGTKFLFKLIILFFNSLYTHLPVEMNARTKRIKAIKRRKEMNCLWLLYAICMLKLYVNRMNGVHWTSCPNSHNVSVEMKELEYAKLMHPIQMFQRMFQMCMNHSVSMIRECMHSNMVNKSPHEIIYENCFLIVSMSSDACVPLIELWRHRLYVGRELFVFQRHTLFFHNIVINSMFIKFNCERRKKNYAGACFVNGSDMVA